MKPHVHSLTWGALWIPFMWFGMVPAWSQQNYSLLVIPSLKDSLVFSKPLQYKKVFSDTLARKKEVDRILSTLIGQGYLQATIDSFYDQGALRTVWLSTGPVWKWIALQPGTVDPLILQRVGFKPQEFMGKPIQPLALQNTMERLLAYYENHGYPFARIRLDSIWMTPGLLSASLSVDPGVMVVIDSLVVRGKARIATKFLAPYLGLRLPMPYKEAVVRQSAARLQELAFLTLLAPPQVVFAGPRATLNVMADNRNASRFDIVLGLLPNHFTSGRLVLTGEGDLHLLNALGRGETIKARLSRLSTRTAQLQLQADYPFLLGFPFGVEGMFHLLRNDSLYVDLWMEMGLKYLFSAQQHVKFHVRRLVTNIVSVDTLRIVQTRALPPYLDSRQNLFGAQWQLYRTDNRRFPTKGWQATLGADVGVRKVRTNALITQLKDPSEPQFDFRQLYDSIVQPQTRVLLQAQADKYWPVAHRNITRTSYRGGWMYSPAYLLNELFRIGGLHLLRGFDEQSLFVTQYHVLTLEHRLLLAEGTYLYAFIDGAWVENRLSHPAVRDKPIGFGAGMTFQTRAGVFTVNYALGRQLAQPIQFRSAKVHFGYVNYF